MKKAWGEDPGGVHRELTERERTFLDALGEAPPHLDTWLHRDPDGSPWLIVSLDLTENNCIMQTLRVDFDGTQILGGSSPACLNWDDGVRAREANIDTTAPSGIEMRSEDPVQLARSARAWFLMRSQSWPR